jgi:predicted acetyltransferase
MIRNATREDVRELAELWARAFPGERTVDQRIAQLEAGGTFGGIETAWLAEESGLTVGAFRAFTLTQHLHGTTYPMMGLAAVAVDETARRRGLGRELCTHAIRIARERSDVLSVLYPFRPAFYEALGWGMVGELQIFRFRPESLRATVGTGVRRARPDEAGAIADCYERVARRTNGLLQRTGRLWRHHLGADGVQVYVTGEDDVRGYAIVRQGRSASPDERPLYIRELIADDGDAYETLLGWLSAQRDSTRLIHYEAAPDELFAHRLVEPRPPGFQNTRNLWAPVSRVIRGPMLRLLDVGVAFERRVRWGPAAPLRFGLHIEDRLVPENDGEFVVDFDGGRTTLRPGSAAPTLRLPVAVLAQIFAGELTVDDALTLGHARGDGDLSAVAALFRVDGCFRLLDEF